MASKKANTVEKKLKWVGKRMKEVRKAQHSNYEHFAYENDLNRVQYGRYENGSDLRLSTFLRILEALQITPQEFFEGAYKE